MPVSQEKAMIDEIVSKLKDGWLGSIEILNLSTDYSDHYIVRFSNGYQASILYSDYSYGLEMAVLKDGEITYDTPITDDIIAYIGSYEELVRYCQRVSNLTN